MPTPILLMVRELAVGGGCERDLTKLALTIDRQKFAPHVACFHEGYRADELRAAGVPVTRFDVHSFRDRSALSGIAQFRRYTHQHGIRLVHAKRLTHQHLRRRRRPPPRRHRQPPRPSRTRLFKGPLPRPPLRPPRPSHRRQLRSHAPQPHRRRTCARPKDLPLLQWLHAGSLPPHSP